MAEEAIARARAIAAKLNASVGGGGGGLSSDLGKRKNRWDEPGAASGYGLGHMQRKKVYIPTREHPDINFLGLLIGPRGRTQKELEQRTGAKIIIRGRGSQKDGVVTGHPEDDDDLHVCIEGPGDSVNAALSEVEEILFNPEQALKLKEEQLRNLAAMQTSLQEYTPSGALQRLSDGEAMIELKVPNHLVGYIIGKGGENIQRMQMQTGVHVQIAKESEMKPGDTTRNVVLRGPERGVEECKRRVDDLVAERLNYGKGASKQDQIDNYAFVLKVAVPNDKVGIIIGKGGTTVKAIQDRTTVYVHIPPDPDEDNPMIRTLSICGDTREAVEAGQMEISSTLQQQAQQASAPLNAMYMLVPDDKVGIIIGRSGATIKDIQNRHNVRIQIPQSADPGTMPPVRTISIQGTQQDQYGAKFEIEGMLGMDSSYDVYGGMGYGAYGATDPYAGGAYYGYGQQQPQQQADGATGSYYDATSAHAQQQGADGSAAAAQPDLSDPTAYYKDFWNYAAYYGEAAARAYYTTWSPPEGTPPPEGIVLPPSQPSAENGQAAAPTGEAQAGQQQYDEAAMKAYNEQYAEWYRQQAAQYSADSAQQNSGSGEAAAPASSDSKQ
mmetsp:Transcript_23077/g.33798  ORF Transcript_23077/g.33798 Transcript_23077/m.33798 type:complete len:609 (-) Transcript_23077:193-2019(-)